MSKAPKKRNKKYNNNEHAFKRVAAVWDDFINKFVVTSIDKFDPCPFYVEELVTRLQGTDVDKSIIAFNDYCFNKLKDWKVFITLGFKLDDSSVEYSSIVVNVKNSTLTEVGDLFESLRDEFLKEHYEDLDSVYNDSNYLGYCYCIAPDGGVNCDYVIDRICDKIIEETDSFDKFRDKPDRPVNGNVIKNNIDFVIAKARKLKERMR